MKPKLCYVLPEYETESHTHFSYLHEFVKRLSRDFDIFLIIERGERPADGLGCSKVKLAESGITLARLLKTEFFLWRARFWGARNFYVHYSFYAAYVAAWIAKFTGSRIFYWNCGETWKFRRPILRELFERLVYKLIDYLVTGTEISRQDYARHYNLPLSKIKAMPNWINLQQFRSGTTRISTQINAEVNNELREKLKIKKEQKVILFVHRLSKRKGAHYLPEIAKKLADASAKGGSAFGGKDANKNANDAKDFILLIIGDGPERENIQLQITNYQLHDKVRFLGWVPNYQLPNYYSIADVFIMPSEEEGFPHVILEAMAFGVPFVASDVGGVKNIVPEETKRYIAKAGDIGEFAAKIDELISRPNEGLKESLLSWVKNYDLPEVAKKFTELLK